MCIPHQDHGRKLGLITDLFIFGTKFWLSEKGLFGRAGIIPTFQFMELQGIVGFYRDFYFFTCCKVIVRFE